ncbi:hypothetical protein E4U13_003969 [Claviceps humidiphila]|uniref:Uncharacterized protein n=1 Tax=Claviceps humidiphila TaxID=1294629 RepID=A0A9P7PYW7_9HYPO|nr:hypothetical protein E4U13_003969 [Claviceps humidiphila]
MSEIHREIVCRDLENRYVRLLVLRSHALQHATQSVIKFMSTITPLPPPSDTELEELEDAPSRAGSPRLNEDQRERTSNGRGQIEHYEDVEEDDGSEESDVEIALVRYCRERDDIETIIYRRLNMLEREPTMEDLLPWWNTFPGMLEAYLDHLDEHCCPCDKELAQRVAAEGLGRPPDDPNRHKDCVSVRIIDRLQEELDQTWAFIKETDNRSMRRSRRSNPRATRNVLLKSRGMGGSPLVKAWTPDQMSLFETWSSCSYDQWCPTETSLSWVSPTSPEGSSGRSVPRILVEVEISTEISAAEGSETPVERYSSVEGSEHTGEQSTIR